MNYKYWPLDYIKDPIDPVRHFTLLDHLILNRPVKNGASGSFPIFAFNTQHNNFRRMVEWGWIHREVSSTG